MNTGSEVNQYGFHLKNIPQAFLRRLANLRTEYRHTLILVLLAGMLMSCDSATDETGNNDGGDKKIQLSLGGGDDVATQPEKPVTGGGDDDGVVRIALSSKDIKAKEAGDLAVANGARLPEDTPGGYGAEDEPIGGTSGGDNLAEECKNNNQRAKLRNTVASFNVNVLNSDRVKNEIVRGKMKVKGVGTMEWSIVETKSGKFITSVVQMFISEYDEGVGRLAIGNTVIDPTAADMGTINLVFSGKRNNHTGLVVELGGAFAGNHNVEDVIEFLKLIESNSYRTF